LLVLRTISIASRPSFLQSRLAAPAQLPAAVRLSLPVNVEGGSELAGSTPDLSYPLKLASTVLFRLEELAQKIEGEDFRRGDHFRTV